MARLIAIHFVDFDIVTLGIFLVQRGKLIGKRTAFLQLRERILLFLLRAFSLVYDIYLLVKWKAIRNLMNNSAYRPLCSEQRPVE
ncbi:hypothetical protein [Candidatus Accumulibacter vicinus]|uniref:Uncharacterized protein n=1 Tax=Candidatus Accumulibacter vicinus TaxID=2954382 RepID=A0A084XZI8_9PROT|nr:hypothetical protein [Candidatus Accumulibacter vicinus]KFB67882.1 MAG: hypothetical protein CAPSK01_002470 [Candidatus Accumulibacter vicinus]